MFLSVDVHRTIVFDGDKGSHHRPRSNSLFEMAVFLHYLHCAVQTLELSSFEAWLVGYHLPAHHRQPRNPPNLSPKHQLLIRSPFHKHPAQCELIELD